MILTQEELDAIPRDDLFSVRETIVDGRRVATPVMPQIGAVFDGGERPPIRVTDTWGAAWLVHWVGDRRFKRGIR